MDDLLAQMSLILTMISVGGVMSVGTTAKFSSHVQRGTSVVPKAHRAFFVVLEVGEVFPGGLIRAARFPIN
jgi:hypothetical protein